MRGWNIHDLLDATVEEVEATRVDCGNCPVNIQCAIGEGGTGWRNGCCNATGVESGGDMLIIDCAINGFQESQRSQTLGLCGVCSGDIVKAFLIEMTPTHRYVPTIHAKFHVRDRLAVFKSKIGLSHALKKQIDKSRK